MTVYERKLSDAQIKLLCFLRLTPSPTLGELGSYAQATKMDAGTLLHNLIALLYQRMIYPHAVNRSTLLPAYVDLSEEGRRLAVDREALTREEEMAWVSLEMGRRNTEGSTIPWPARNQWPVGDLEDLLSTYLFLGKSKTNSPQIDCRDLTRAAMEGYYETRQRVPFRDALRTWMEQTDDSFMLHEFLVDIFRMNRYEGAFGEEVRSQAAEPLTKVYWQVTSEILPPLTSEQIMEEQLKRLFDRLDSIGRQYKLGVPSPESLQISNRIEDLMSLAFTLNSRDVYGQVIILLANYLELCRSMLRPENDAEEFDGRAGYSDGVHTAMLTCQYLEALSRAVKLPDPPRKEARRLVVEAIRYAIKIVASPTLDKVREQIRHSEGGAVWLCRLLDRSSVREELVDTLESLRTLLIENGTQAQPVPSAIAVSPCTLEDLRALALKADQRLNKMEQNMGQIVWLFANQLVLASRNNEALYAICKIVASSHEMLEGFDRQMADREADLRLQLEGLRQSVDGVEGAVEEEKRALSDGLKKLAEQKSSAKMVVELPLIPGFLKYKDEFNIKFDMKGWFSTLI
jgi:hypothetical protein